jgi:hypothetical protein
MKTTVAVLVAILISTVITYLAGSFVEWDFDPKNWGNGLRALMVITWVAVTAIAYLLIKIMEDK